MESLPDLLSRCLTQHQERIEQRRNFLHPDTAAVAPIQAPTPQSMFNAAPMLFPHSRWVVPSLSLASLSVCLCLFFSVCLCLCLSLYVYEPCPLSSSKHRHTLKSIHMSISLKRDLCLSFQFVFVRSSASRLSPCREYRGPQIPPHPKKHPLYEPIHSVISRTHL